MSTAPLSLYRGDDLPPSDSPSLAWTLTDLYLGILIHLRKSPGTVKKDLHLLRWWKILTGDPPLRDVTQEFCDAFAEGLAAAVARGGGPLAVNTRRSLLIHWHWMINQLGPRKRRYAKALKLWAEPFWVEIPAAEEARVKDIWRLDELGPLLAATALTKRPEWWQALFLFLYNTGQRIGAVMQARWENVDRNERGWLFLPRETMKGGRRSHEIPINSAAREAMELVHIEGEPRIFGRPWPGAKSSMARTLGRIKARSGLPFHRLDGFGVHALRGCCYTEGSKINSKGADLLLGHHGVSIGVDCYAGRELMLEVVQKLPQPRFARQARLF